MTASVVTAGRMWAGSRRRIYSMAIGLFSVLVYEAARAFYRPFIFAHGIDDLHIADTLGNSLGTLATIFVFVSLFGVTYPKGLLMLHVSVMAVVVYELSHPLLGKPVDVWDVSTTILTGTLSSLLYRSLPREPVSQPESEQQ